MHEDDKDIDCSDIPEVTDFSNWRKNPFAGRFKNGYTVIVEHKGYNEIRNYDFAKIPRPNDGLPIPFEVKIEKKEDILT